MQQFLHPRSPADDFCASLKLRLTTCNSDPIGPEHQPCAHQHAPQAGPRHGRHPRADASPKFGPPSTVQSGKACVQPISCHQLAASSYTAMIMCHPPCAGTKAPQRIGRHRSSQRSGIQRKTCSQKRGEPSARRPEPEPSAPRKPSGDSSHPMSSCASSAITPQNLQRDRNQTLALPFCELHRQCALKALFAEALTPRPPPFLVHPGANGSRTGWSSSTLDVVASCSTRCCILDSILR